MDGREAPVQLAFEANQLRWIVIQPHVPLHTVLAVEICVVPAEVCLQPAVPSVVAWVHPPVVERPETVSCMACCLMITSAAFICASWYIVGSIYV